MSEVERLRRLASLALADERQGARWFYYEAHRFCQWLAGMSGLTGRTTAGVVAALSPRNSWEANQLDAIALCQGAEPRNGSSFGAMSRDARIALRIIEGEDPEGVFGGPKVNAFFRNLHRPWEDVGVPIDRHLGRALWGVGISDSELSRRATKEWSMAEGLFWEAADLDGLRAIEFANRVWFVMRRLSRQNGQHSMDRAAVRWRPFYPGGEYRYRPMYSPRMDLLPGCPWRPWLAETPLPGPRFGHETRDFRRGRVRVTIGKGHRFANSAGWQWRYRLVVAYALGELPRPDEHVDHENGVVDDDRLEKLRVLAAAFHGQIHGSAAEVAGWNHRGPDGRFRAYEDLAEIVEFPVNRWGPILSPRPIDPATRRPEERILATGEREKSHG